MSDGLVSYVLAGCAFDAPCETVAKSFAERFGGAIGPAWVKSSTIKDKTVEDKMGFILSVGGIDVLVIYEDFPVPAETFTGAVTYAVLSGSDEVEQRRLVDHRAHAIVAAMGSHAEHEFSVRAATSVLRVCSVLSELNESTAVFWTELQTLTAAVVFRDLVGKIERGLEHLPLEILMRAFPYQIAGEAGSAPSIGIAAVGFRPFIGRNIEFAPKPLSYAVMANRLEGVGRWLLMKGLDFADGDTYGVANEITRVRYREKGDRLAGPVLLMDIEKVAPSF